MLTICCVNAGDYCARGREYVEVLFDSVRRNLAEGYPGRFVVFTDDPVPYAAGIVKRELPVAGLVGWFNKLALFKEGVFEVGERVIFLDLDTLITDSFDSFADYRGSFAILRDFYRPNGLQSAVMAWTAGECSDIWASFDAGGWPDIDGGDQAWIERCRPDAVRLQDVFPDLFVSYKLIQGIPNSASICCFHGQPRPHHVLTGWVPEVWRVGGLTGASLKSICNTQNERLLGNVRSAISRDVPWFDFDNTANEEQVVIVGGGPSLNRTLAEIQHRYRLGQKVWALNATAKWLRDRGVIPHAHVLVDARPDNARFLEGAHRETVHYLASQCDPSLFEALVDRKVVLWHANSPGVADLLRVEPVRPAHLIGGGSSVGINAISLAYLAGFRRIHLHGFDSSYDHEQHHAYRQSMNEGEKIVDALFGERRFRAAPWMIQQANEFRDLATQLVQEGVVFTVAGDGLLPYMARCMVVPPTMADVRVQEVLKRLTGQATKGAEIGVFGGDMSARLLDGSAGLSLIMVDSWEGDGAAYQPGDADFHAGLTQDQQDALYEVALRKTAFAQKRRTVIRKRSVTAAKEVSDGSLDFVFLDADHSFEGCQADIAAWAPKVKFGGWLCGHDFAHPEFPMWGVERAVRAWLASSGLSLELGDNYTWFVQINAAQPRQEKAA